MCPVCETTLDQSNSPVALQIKRVISQRIAAGDTKSQIKDELVAAVRRGDPRRAAAQGFGLLAWLLPIVGHRSRRPRSSASALALEPHTRADRRTPDGRALDPALERRLDERARAMG